jgi:NADPH2:quinone reductase
VKKDIWPAVASRKLQLPIDKVYKFADIGNSVVRLFAKH